MNSFKVESTWTDKDSKVDRYRTLYEKNEFIPAYAAHTDLRVVDNPQGAIGREDEWDTHGDLQRSFLIAQGLTPQSRLLDLGCGTGRLARKIVPYLDEAHYTGADISAGALAHAEHLANVEGWSARCPELVQIDGTLDHFVGRGDRFDMTWAHSVFTHLPQEAIERVIEGLSRILVGKFLFTFKLGKRPERTGLKQFRYDPETFAHIAHQHGFKFDVLPTIWPASQRTGLMIR